MHAWLFCDVVLQQHKRRFVCHGPIVLLLSSPVPNYHEQSTAKKFKSPAATIITIVTASCIFIMLGAHLTIIYVQASETGQTALAEAVLHGSESCVTMLINSGANKDLPNNSGCTPLELAGTGICKDSNKMLEILLEAGATVPTMSKMQLLGFTPEAMAMLRPKANADESGSSSTAMAPLPRLETPSTVHEPPVESYRIVDWSHASGSQQESGRSQEQRMANGDISNRHSGGISTPIAQREPSQPFQKSIQEWKIKFDDLELTELIGRGSFGKVHAATWHEADVAVKMFDIPTGAASSNAVAAFTNVLCGKIDAEIALLASLRHPNVVAFLGAVESPPCVVTELCENGSLYDIIARVREDPSEHDFPWPRRMKISLDIAVGMAHLHAKKILHRDLKSPNILLTNDWTAKISDLGLSKLVEEANNATGTIAGNSTAGGPANPRWLAPEVVAGGKADGKSDVYSMGVIMYELITCYLPWQHVANPFMIIVALNRGESLPLPADLSSLPGTPAGQPGFVPYLSLMKKCLSHRPSERPTFKEIAREMKKVIALQPDRGSMSSKKDSLDGDADVGSNSTGVSGSGGQNSVTNCVICLSKPAVAALLHRGERVVAHKCCCETCAEKLLSEGIRCPICRHTVDEIIVHVY